MMQVKFFEVRDWRTFIPVMATRFEPRNEQERYLLSRAGYGKYGLGTTGKAGGEPYHFSHIWLCLFLLW